MDQTKIQKVRQAAGLSQSQLAEKAGISVRTLQSWERGARDIRKASVETVLALAYALDCRMEDLLDLERIK